MEWPGIRPVGQLFHSPEGNQASSLDGSAGGKDAVRLQRVQAGDKTVWDEWFNDYYRPLFRYSYLRLRSRSEAEDAVSQVFVEAYRGIGRYKHTGKPLLAWLYRIAHNVIYDRLKAESRRAESVESGDLALGEGPEAKIVSIDLLNAIDELTPEQRVKLEVISNEFRIRAERYRGRFHNSERRPEDAKSAQ